jgi:outer membrane lipoprotein-sorting protein
VSALRRISTRRLIALCAVTAAAVIGVVAVAAAMSGGGPKPAPKPLANAVHDALSAPAMPGISARIQFTNHLVDASSIEGTDPLLSGASGRLWASPDGGGKLRLELQSEGGGGDTQVLVADHHFEIYDGSSETVYKGTLPEEGGKDSQGEAGKDGQDPGVPGLGEIETKISEVEKNADLSGATPSDVAGQPTYTLRVAPKHDGGLLGGAEIAWDANHGTPLRAAIYSSSSSSPVLQLEATEVSFEAVPSSVFAISPPPGANVVDLNPGEEAAGEEHGEPTSKEGAAAVQKSLDFQLVAPSSLAGLPQGEVRSIEVDGKTAALATYGKGLGGIAVIETASEPGGEEAGSGDEAGLSLPKVSINGASGEELDTALGTVLRFSRGGVDYIVIGSVPPAAAEAAARAL